MPDKMDSAWSSYRSALFVRRLDREFQTETFVTTVVLPLHWNGRNNI